MGSIHSREILVELLIDLRLLAKYARENSPTPYLVHHYVWFHPNIENIWNYHIRDKFSTSMNLGFTCKEIILVASES